MGSLAFRGRGVGVVVIWWCKLKIRAWVEIYTKFFFSNDFHFSALCFDMPLLSFGLF